MEELINIVENGKKSCNINLLIKDLEVYISKKTSILNYEETKENVRIFPKNETHYIDFSYDYRDDRVYIVFKKIFDNGLINYIKKLYAHNGTLIVTIKNIYTIEEVQKEFDKHFEYNIKVINDDEWDYKILQE